MLYHHVSHIIAELTGVYNFDECMHALENEPSVCVNTCVFFFFFFFVTAIQCKGCMLIRFLSCESYLTSRSLCTFISKVVVDALSKRSDIRLQMEVKMTLFRYVLFHLSRFPTSLPVCLLPFILPYPPHFHHLPSLPLWLSCPLI